jgi:lipoprotein-anchoring transpeptidase ErfK/SrfK
MRLKAKWLGAALPVTLSLLAASPALSGQQDTTRAAASSDPRPFSILVDLSERQLYVRRGDDVIETFQVAVGTDAHPTPKGTYRIRKIVWNPRWVPPDEKWARGKRPQPPGSPNNPMGRVKLFFVEPDYYIHGTRNEESLGQAESHGCVRMRNPEVIRLATSVMENGGEQRPPSWFRRVINRVTHTEQVQLSQPVQVTIRE